MNVHTLMLEVKDKLQGINGVVTVKIGIEPNMTGRDYPAVRIVAGTNRRGEYLYENIIFTVYFGENLHDKIGMEEIYNRLYAYESEIRDRLDTFQPTMGGLCKWIDTVSDEDRLEGFKILASRFEVSGA
jgi:hypothetical protein